MQRVMIIGISGAGKSTLSRRLHERLGLPIYHLDNIYHSAGWVARPPEDVQRDFDAIAAQKTWVVDGNFRKLSGALRERADTLVFLDFGRVYCIWQVTKRWAMHKLGLRKRVDLAEGFPEQLPFDFIKWVWNWHANNRPNWLIEIKKFKGNAIIFKTRHEVNHWLESL
jgi:adenylate kinase family enzyme